MSYAEVVRFISVQPFPLQHHLSFSLSLHFSRIRSFASPIFSCPTRLTLLPHPFSSTFFPLFHILGPSALFHPVSALFTTLSFPSSFLRLSENCTPLFSATLIFRERSSETSLFLPSSDGIFNVPPA